jgi:hypothetical protein
VGKLASEDNDHLDYRQRENLRLDYEQTGQYLQMLTNIRYLPLTILPGTAAAAVTVLTTSKKPEAGLAVGLVGMLASIGIILFDLHNTALRDAAVRRAQRIEVSLGLPPLAKTEKSGGLYNESPDGLEVFHYQRPTKSRSLTVRQDIAVAVVYGVAIGAWAHVLVHSSLSMLLSGSSSVPTTPIASLLALVVVTAVSAWTIPRIIERNRAELSDENGGGGGNGSARGEREPSRREAS